MGRAALPDHRARGARRRLVADDRVEVLLVPGEPQDILVASAAVAIAFLDEHAIGAVGRHAEDADRIAIELSQRVRVDAMVVERLTLLALGVGDNHEWIAGEVEAFAE